MSGIEILPGSKIFLIVCGSLISTMESLLSYKNPLYGRATLRMNVLPFSWCSPLIVGVISSFIFIFYCQYDTNKMSEECKKNAGANGRIMIRHVPIRTAIFMESSTTKT